MATFGTRSSSELITCCSEIQKVANIVILVFDHSAIKGAREKDEQNGLFDDGFTTLKWPHSKHNVTENRPKSDAIDIWPYTKRWGALSGHPDQIAKIATHIKKSQETLAQAQTRARQYVYKAFALQAGYYLGVASVLGYKFVWGGDWNSNGDFLDQNFHDLPHIQIQR